MIVGLIGCVLPVIPGPPISYIGIVIAHLTKNLQYSTEALFIYAFLAIGVTILDYFVPIWGTKKFGGSKAGIWGSTIGLIFGVVILPILGIVIGPFGLLGIILGPFLGALVGEMMTGKESNEALRASFGAFIGFLTGTFMKLVISGYFTFVFIRKIVIS